jgi:hypothetical protein
MSKFSPFGSCQWQFRPRSPLSAPQRQTSIVATRSNRIGRCWPRKLFVRPLRRLRSTRELDRQRIQRWISRVKISERLVSGISIQLEQPKVWEPRTPTEEEQSAILNAIRSKVGDRFDHYCRQVLVQHLRTIQWLPAYQRSLAQAQRGDVHCRTHCRRSGPIA